MVMRGSGRLISSYSVVIVERETVRERRRIEWEGRRWVCRCSREWRERLMRELCLRLELKWMRGQGWGLGLRKGSGGVHDEMWMR